MQKIYWYSD